MVTLEQGLCQTLQIKGEPQSCHCNIELCVCIVGLYWGNSVSQGTCGNTHQQFGLSLQEKVHWGTCQAEAKTVDKHLTKQGHLPWRTLSWPKM
jgi:hypothetical protein